MQEETVKAVFHATQSIQAEVGKVIIGKDDVISKVLMSLNVNMTSLQSRSTDEGDAIMDMTFTVTGTEQLKVILTNLRKLPEVIEVYRV